MLVILFGSVIDLRELQLENAPSPMLVMLFGSVIDLRELQQSNALSPMLVTLLGMVMEVIESKKKHNIAGIYSTLSPKTKVLIFPPLNGSLPKSAHFFAFQNTVESEEQLVNTWSPKFDTLLPIVIVLRESQAPKAASPMLVTLLGMVTEVIEFKL